MQRSGWEDVLGKKKSRSLKPKGTGMLGEKRAGVARAGGQRAVGGVKSERCEVGALSSSGKSAWQRRGRVGRC